MGFEALETGSLLRWVSIFPLVHIQSFRFDFAYSLRNLYVGPKNIELCVQCAVDRYTLNVLNSCKQLKL